MAQDVRIGQPAALGRPGEMARIGSLSFTLEPWALLDRQLRIPEIRFEQPHIQLVRLSDGRHNWQFAPAAGDQRWHLQLDRVSVTAGVLRLDDALQGAELQLDIDTNFKEPVYGLRWTLHGQVGKANVAGSGKGGAILSLQHQTQPYPLLAELALGSSRVRLEGSLTRPSQLAALDLHLMLAGPSLARLDDWLPLVLPETPAFSTSGRLRAELKETGTRWRYQAFQGKIGSSDIGGDLEFATGQGRPHLRGRLQSRLLRSADLQALIGADSNQEKRAREVAPVQPAGKLLPVERFRTERWQRLDADVWLHAERILRDQASPLQQLQTHIQLRQGVLDLDPLSFHLAGGQVQAKIRLDSSAAGALQARSQISARHLRIRQLWPQLDASVGEINADARLSGQGNSVAALLASADGEGQAVSGRGQISKLLLEEMGLNVGNIILARLFGDKPVAVHCALADFSVKNGLMQVRRAGVDTEAALIHLSGSLNLANEQLDLVIRPDSKGLRIFSLRTPLYARGSLSKPEVGVDKGKLALRAGSALALGAVAPLAALLPLVSSGPDQRENCKTLLGSVR